MIGKDALWDDDEIAGIRPDQIVATGQVAAFFPDEPPVSRWKDAENNPDHRAIDVGPNATCSCGWKGPSWNAHFLAATGSK